MGEALTNCVVLCDVVDFMHTCFLKIDLVLGVKMFITTASVESLYVLVWMSMCLFGRLGEECDRCTGFCVLGVVGLHDQSGHMSCVPALRGGEQSDI